MFKREGYRAYLVPVSATCFSVVKEKSNSQIGFFRGWIKLTVKESVLLFVAILYCCCLSQKM